MTTIEELEFEKFLRARYSGELIGDSESMLHKNKNKDIFSCHVCVWQEYQNTSLYQFLNPLKIEFLFAIIIGFIGTAVSYSTFWGAVAFFCILSFRMG